MGKSKYDPRFLHRSIGKLALPSASPGIINFEHDGALAYAALIIDYFLSQATKAGDKPADKLLSILHHPKLQTQQNITPSEYLHQLCLTSDNPSQLTALMRSISAAVKQIVIDDMMLNTLYYQTLRSTIKGPLNREALRRPLAINPYIDQAMYHAVGFNFACFEVSKTKILAKKSPIPHLNEKHPALIMNWQDNDCLISAAVNHSTWFLSLIPEKTHAVLLKQDDLHQPFEQKTAFISSKLCPSEIRERYLLIKRRYDDLNLPINELQDLYKNALDHVIKKPHETYRGISFGSQYLFQEKLVKKSPSLNGLCIGYSARIKQELNDALARFEALNIIPMLTLDLTTHESKTQEISYTINRQ